MEEVVVRRLDSVNNSLNSTRASSKGGITGSEGLDSSQKRGDRKSEEKNEGEKADHTSSEKRNEAGEFPDKNSAEDSSSSKHIKDEKTEHPSSNQDVMLDESGISKEKGDLKEDIPAVRQVLASQEIKDEDQYGIKPEEKALKVDSKREEPGIVEESETSQNESKVGKEVYVGENGNNSNFTEDFKVEQTDPLSSKQDLTHSETSEDKINSKIEVKKEISKNDTVGNPTEVMVSHEDIDKKPEENKAVVSTEIPTSVNNSNFTEDFKVEQTDPLSLNQDLKDSGTSEEKSDSKIEVKDEVYKNDTVGNKIEVENSNENIERKSYENEIPPSVNNSNFTEDFKVEQTDPLSLNQDLKDSGTSEEKSDSKIEVEDEVSKNDTVGNQTEVENSNEDIERKSYENEIPPSVNNSNFTEDFKVEQTDILSLNQDLKDSGTSEEKRVSKIEVKDEVYKNDTVGNQTEVVHSNEDIERKPYENEPEVSTEIPPSVILHKEPAQSIEQSNEDNSKTIKDEESSQPETVETPQASKLPNTSSLNDSGIIIDYKENLAHQNNDGSPSKPVNYTTLKIEDAIAEANQNDNGLRKLISDYKKEHGIEDDYDPKMSDNGLMQLISDYKKEHGLGEHEHYDHDIIGIDDVVTNGIASAGMLALSLFIDVPPALSEVNTEGQLKDKREVDHGNNTKDSEISPSTNEVKADMKNESIENVREDDEHVIKDNLENPQETSIDPEYEETIKSEEVKKEKPYETESFRNVNDDTLISSPSLINSEDLKQNIIIEDNSQKDEPHQIKEDKIENLQEISEDLKRSQDLKVESMKSEPKEKRLHEEEPPEDVNTVPSSSTVIKKDDEERIEDIPKNDDINKHLKNDQAEPQDRTTKEIPESSITQTIPDNEEAKNKKIINEEKPKETDGDSESSPTDSLESPNRPASEDRTSDDSLEVLERKGSDELGPVELIGKDHKESDVGLVDLLGKLLKETRDPLGLSGREPVGSEPIPSQIQNRDSIEELERKNSDEEYSVTLTNAPKNFIKEEYKFDRKKWEKERSEMNKKANENNEEFLEDNIIEPERNENIKPTTLKDEQSKAELDFRKHRIQKGMADKITQDKTNFPENINDDKDDAEIEKNDKKEVDFMKHRIKKGMAENVAVIIPTLRSAPEKRKVRSFDETASRSYRAPKLSTEKRSSLSKNNVKDRTSRLKPQDSEDKDVVIISSTKKKPPQKKKLMKSFSYVDKVQIQNEPPKKSIGRSRRSVDAGDSRIGSSKKGSIVSLGVSTQIDPRIAKSVQIDGSFEDENIVDPRQEHFHLSTQSSKSQDSVEKLSEELNEPSAPTQEDLEKEEEDSSTDARLSQDTSVTPSVTTSIPLLNEDVVSTSSDSSMTTIASQKAVEFKRNGAKAASSQKVFDSTKSLESLKEGGPTTNSLGLLKEKSEDKNQRLRKTSGSTKEEGLISSQSETKHSRSIEERHESKKEESSITHDSSPQSSEDLVSKDSLQHKTNLENASTSKSSTMNSEITQDLSKSKDKTEIEKSKGKHVSFDKTTPVKVIRSLHSSQNEPELPHISSTIEINEAVKPSEVQETVSRTVQGALDMGLNIIKSSDNLDGTYTKEEQPLNKTYTKLDILEKSVSDVEEAIGKTIQRSLEGGSRVIGAVFDKGAQEEKESKVDEESRSEKDTEKISSEEDLAGNNVEKEMESSLKQGMEDVKKSERFLEDVKDGTQRLTKKVSEKISEEADQTMNNLEKEMELSMKQGMEEVQKGERFLEGAKDDTKTLIQDTKEGIEMDLKNILEDRSKTVTKLVKQVDTTKGSVEKAQDDVIKGAQESVVTLEEKLKKGTIEVVNEIKSSLENNADDMAHRTKELEGNAASSLRAASDDTKQALSSIEKETKDSTKIALEATKHEIDKIDSSLKNAKAETDILVKTTEKAMTNAEKSLTKEGSNVKNSLEKEVIDGTNEIKVKGEDALTKIERSLERIAKDVDDDVKDTILKNSEDIKDDSQDMKDLIVKDAEDIEKTLKDESQDIKATILKNSEDMKDDYQDIKDSIVKDAKSIKQTVKDESQDIKAAILKNSEDIKDGTLDIKDSIVKDAKSIKKTLKDESEGMKDAISKNSEDMKDDYQDIKDSIVKDAKSIKQTVKDESQDIKAAILKNSEDIKDGTLDIKSSIVKDAKSIKQNVKDESQDIKATILKNSEDMKDDSRDIKDSIMKDAKSINQTLKDESQAMKNAIAKASDETLEENVKEDSNIMKKFTKGVGNFYDKSVKAVKNILPSEESKEKEEPKPKIDLQKTFIITKDELKDFLQNEKAHAGRIENLNATFVISDTLSAKTNTQIQRNVTEKAPIINPNSVSADKEEDVNSEEKDESKIGEEQFENETMITSENSLVKIGSSEMNDLFETIDTVIDEAEYSADVIHNFDDVINTAVANHKEKESEKIVKAEIESVLKTAEKAVHLLQKQTTVDEPECIKKTVSLTNEDNKLEDIDISRFEKDSLEAMYYSLKKNDIMVDRMQRRASEQKIELNATPRQLSGESVAPLEFEDNSMTSINVESSDKEETEIEVKSQKRPSLSLIKMHTIAGDMNFETSFTSDEIRELDKERSLNKSLDELTSENIKLKMRAFSVSFESNGEDNGSFDDVENVMEIQAKNMRDDFNISTALEPITSTDTDSSIVSAVTKIQAGTRGFLTRKKLRSKAETYEPKASFGNGAISESLENLVEDEAAKKIQNSYRSYKAKKSHRQIRTMDDCEIGPLPPSLAARRLTLQRGDAVQNDSNPDDEVDAGTTKLTAKEKADKWMAHRQNSMPVQIDCAVLRFLPKRIKKRIKSAEMSKKKAPKKRLP
ncbi:hypothetical protein ACFFRR_007755 [Megaselia abdita]